MAAIYNMKHRRRGKAVLINNINFDVGAKLKRREGSRVDYDAMRECLHNLRFTEIDQKEGLTKNEILMTLDKVSREDHSDADSLFVCLMSHGGEEGICGVDYNRRTNTGLLTLQDIIEPFKGDRCPSLAGKPKIFILNACRGDDIDPGVQGEDVTDSFPAFPVSTPGQRVPITADIFVCFSCSEGYSTLRDPISGSYFIQDLTSVLNEYSNSLHLNEMILKVKEIVAARQIHVQGCDMPEMQMPVVLDTLRKLVFFHNQPSRRTPSQDILRLIRNFENQR